jgi:hypothetical protein
MLALALLGAVLFGAGWRLRRPTEVVLVEAGHPAEVVGPGLLEDLRGVVAQVNVTELLAGLGTAVEPAPTGGLWLDARDFGLGAPDGHPDRR